MKRAVWGLFGLAGLAVVHFLLLENLVRRGVAAVLLSPGPHLPFEAIGLVLAFVAVRLALYLVGPAALILVLARLWRSLPTRSDSAAARRALGAPSAETTAR